MGAHDGAVEHQPLDVAVGRQAVHQHLPDALFLPANEVLVDAVPRTEFKRQKSPHRRDRRRPEHHLDERPGRRLLLGINVGTSLKRNPNPPQLLARKPYADYPLRHLPAYTSVGSQNDLILNVNSA